MGTENYPEGTIIPKSILSRYIPSLRDEVSPGRRYRILSPFTLGWVIIGFLLIFYLAGHATADFPPSMIKAGPRLMPPDRVYWFGTDALGRDLFSRVVYGLQTSLWISLAATLIAAAPGITLGMVAGYYGGWTEQVLSRLVDVLLSLPGLLLAVVLIARLGPSAGTLVLAMGITGVPTFYRIARVETLSTAARPFIEASRSLGSSGGELILRHIFPNILSPLLAMISIRLGIFLLMGSGLSFIGLGVQAPQVELGALLAAGKEYYASAPWLVIFPGGAILLSALGFNLLGEGLRDRLE